MGVDFAQNMDMPHFGEEQPADIYYFSPLTEGQTGKQLSIVMDNCGGRNKNNNVLRLALYLVELQYFEIVQFVFYVRRHTKNNCDRLFNQLKLRWHKKNTYTMKQLVECLNLQPNVEFIEVTSDSF